MIGRAVTILLLFIHFFGFTGLLSQNVPMSHPSNLKDSVLLNVDMDAELPPLQVLIDSAIVHSPLIKSQNAGIRIKEIEISRAKLLWLDYLFLYGDVKYGSVDNFVYTGTQGGVGQVNSTLVTTRYNAGLTLNISLFDMADQKKQNKIAKENLYIAQNQYDDLIKKLREEVIIRYNQYLLTKRLLSLAIEDRDAKFSSAEIARKQLRSSEINIYEFTVVEDKYNSALQSFEIAKNNFKVAFALLEEIIGLPLNKFKTY